MPGFTARAGRGIVRSRCSLGAVVWWPGRGEPEDGGAVGLELERRELYERLWPYMQQAGATSTAEGKKPAHYGGDAFIFCTRHPDGHKHGRRSLHLSPPKGGSAGGLHCFAGCTESKTGFLNIMDDITGNKWREWQPEGPNAVRRSQARMAARPVQARPSAPARAPEPAEMLTPGAKFMAAQRAGNLRRLPRAADAGENAGSAAREMTEQYEYRKPDGTIVAFKSRWEGGGQAKAFKWRKPTDIDARGVPVWRGLGEGGMRDMPLWGAELVAGWPEAEPVWYAEGEKDTKALREQGLHAVCHGGGASTQDFGTALDVLRGRTVVLWPDNDEDGRSYMNVVAARLKRLHCKVSVIAPPRALEEKEGAADYFGKRGGTLEELTAGVLIEDSVLFNAHDSIAVRLLPVAKPPKAATGRAPEQIYDTPAYPVEFTFSEMEKSTRELSAEMTVRLLGLDDDELEYVQRINVLSHSAFEDVARTLEVIFGAHGSYHWTHMFNRAVTKARRAFLRRDRSRDVFDIEIVNTELYLIDELLPYRQPTIWFGDGSSTKSYSAFRVGLSVMFGWDFAGYSTRVQGPVLVADWETDESNFRRRIGRLSAGLGTAVYPEMMHYWPGLGTPLSDMVEGLRRMIVDNGIVLLIVDSAGYAAGGEPEKADTAIRFFNALSKLPVTTLIVGHIVKGRENDEVHKQRPFGCYSADTEVLTRAGWKRHEDWRAGEEIACFDPATETMRWAVPERLNVYPYTGPMHHYATGSTDCLVTPNHRMVVRREWEGKGEPKRWAQAWQFCESEALPGANLRMPLSTPWNAGQEPEPAALVQADIERPAEAFARFLGWWISEGSIEYTRSGAPCSVMVAQALGEKAERIKADAEAAGIEYTTWEKQWSYPGREHERPMMYLRARKAAGLAGWLVRECGSGAAEKRLPECVWGWSHRDRAALLETLLDGDGSRQISKKRLREWAAYHTASPRLADDVQRLAISLGHAASINVERRKAGWLDAYRININDRARRGVALRLPRHRTVEPYTGAVYCFTTPTGAYLTRRNGKMAIAGNSQYWHLGARATCYIERDPYAMNLDDFAVSFTPRKANDSGMPRGFETRVRFEGRGGPVTIDAYSGSRSRFEVEQGESLMARIAQVLGAGELAADEIAEILEVSVPAVEKTMERYNGSFLQVGEGRSKRWRKVG